MKKHNYFTNTIVEDFAVPLNISGFAKAAFLFIGLFCLTILQINGQTNKNTTQATLEQVEEIKGNIDLANKWQHENSDSAYHYGMIALQLAQQYQVDSLQAIAHHFVGVSHYFRGNFLMMAEHCELGLDTEYAARNKKFATRLWNNLGIAYEMLTDFDNSIYAYNKSMELERQLNNEQGYHETLINLGLLHAKANNPDRGIEILEQALSFFQAEKDTFYIGLSFQNLGKIYHDIKKLDTYDKYARKSLSMFTAINDSARIADIYYNLAIVASSRNDLENWEKYTLKSGAIQPPNLYKETNIMLQLGAIAIHKGNYEEAEKLLLQAMENYENLGAPENMQYAYTQLILLYSRKQDFNRLDTVLSQFDEFVSTRMNEAMMKRFAELDLKYQSYRATHEMQQLKFLNEKKSTTISFLRFLLVTSFLLFIFFAGLSYRLWARNR